MKACVLHAVGDLRYEEVPAPSPGEGEVLLRVRAAGVCGSDIQRVFEKGTYRFPTIPGHEFAGDIVAAGGGADPALVGRRAAVFPLLPCFACPPCRIGEYAQCHHYDYYGSRRDGGFAEYLCVKTWNLVLLPDAVSYEEAALCEPAAVAIHALSQAGIGFGETVTIFGAGAIGLMLAKTARAWGAGRVILADIDRARLGFAARMGFPDLVDSRGTDAAAAVMELTGGRGSDVTLEGTGAGAALESALKSAATFGRVVLMGNPLGDMAVPQKAYWAILRKQLTLAGTWNSSYNDMKNDWKKAIAAMPSLGLTGLITHRYGFERCNEAFDMLRRREEFAVKAMFVHP